VSHDQTTENRNSERAAARETAARRIQDAVDPAGEIARLAARVSELERELALSRITIRGLKRRVDDWECEEEGSGS
jgi:hypothetical protein